MSDTIVDFPKLTQALDAGWQIEIHKNKMGSYTMRARHHNKQMLERIAARLIEVYEKLPVPRPDYDPDFHWSDNYTLITDDFTPEQALTRMAYKVHGEIL